MVSEVVSAAVQKEVGAAVQEQVARMSPEARLEEERKKKQVCVCVSSRNLEKAEDVLISEVSSFQGYSLRYARLN